MRLADFSYDLLQMYVCRAAFPVVAGAVGSACVQIRMGTGSFHAQTSISRAGSGAFRDGLGMRTQDMHARAQTISVPAACLQFGVATHPLMLDPAYRPV
jgi:hypothetical protein